jgi:hypothetical protein
MVIQPHQFDVTVSAAPEQTLSGTVWFGSARVSGMANGERFTAEFDFSHEGFDSKEQAERYARERVEERLAKGLFGTNEEVQPPAPDLMHRRLA